MVVPVLRFALPPKNSSLPMPNSFKEFASGWGSPLIVWLVLLLIAGLMADVLALTLFCFEIGLPEGFGRWSHIGRRCHRTLCASH